MQWRGRRQSDNIQEVGNSSGGLRRTGAVGSIGTIVLALVLWKACGINPLQTMSALQGAQNTLPADSTPAQRTGQDATDRAFVATVLADTEDTWQDISQQAGSTYQVPQLILFNGAVRSACGQAGSSTGPFYCPADHNVYLDTSFFKDMRTELGVSADQSTQSETTQAQAGDFAQAYVIAHEVGHHVQNLLGIAQQVHQAQQRTNEAQANQLSVRLELQADCFAGVWANRTHAKHQFLEAGDIEEALNAATQIGDDRIQARSQGYVVPESFTHGSSAQRVQWFKQGLKTGDIQACDTFS